MRGRREFLGLSARVALGVAALGVSGIGAAVRAKRKPARRARASGAVTLFLCGDVMTGRGIDQILPHRSEPVLYERYVRDARRYVELAERVSGEIARAVEPAYVWGDALTELQRRRPDARIVNLETSITRNDTPWPGKGIHYRMHPGNIACLRAAGLHGCVLANNHVLDWERAGLADTLATLQGAGIAVAGAGLDREAARAPAALPLAAGRRVLVFAAATGDAGVPPEWAADARRSGVHRLPDLSPRTVAQLATEVRRHREPGDRVLFSLHWGGNWGYDIAPAQRAFAHALIDAAGADLVHGHSSHHPKALEVHRGRLILYGCGDFLNDYEGIEGHDAFRDELGLMYFPTLDGDDGRLLALELVPTRIRRLRVDYAGEDDRRWLLATLRREYGAFGCGLEEGPDGAFTLQWDTTGGDS